MKIFEYSYPLNLCISNTTVSGLICSNQVTNFVPTTANFLWLCLNEVCKTRCSSWRSAYFLQSAASFSSVVCRLLRAFNICSEIYNKQNRVHSLYLRNRSALAVNCCVIIHCLEVSCIDYQITSAQLEWFILITYNKRRKHILRLQLLPNFRHALNNSRQ